MLYAGEGTGLDGCYVSISFIRSLSLTHTRLAALIFQQTTMKGLHTLLALACMAALVCVGAHALQFDIETGFEKCLGDEYSQDVLIVGAFKISPSYSTQVYIKVGGRRCSATV